MTLAIVLATSLLSMAPQSALRQSTTSQDKLLATIPADLGIANELIALNNRPCFAARSSLAWSADGKQVAYAGRRGDDWIPVVGDKLGAKYVYASRPELAGGHVFFHVTRDVKEHEQRNWVWIDGDQVGPEDWMGDIAVSRDGKRVAYWTQPGAKVGSGAQSSSWDQILATASEGVGGRWTVARGGKWKSGAQVRPVFAADGKSVFAGAAGEKGWTVLQAAGKRETALCDPVTLIDSFAISDDGAAVAVLSTRAMTEISGPRARAGDGPELTFKGARVGVEFAAISAVAVDPTGVHVAYVVDVATKRSVAVDSEREPPGAWDHVGEILFDARGSQLAFVVNVGGALSSKVPGAVEGGESSVVVRKVGDKAAPVESKKFREVRDLVWDASGSKLAYAARDEAGWRLVCGESVSAAHTDVGRPNFSADGKSIGFGTRDKNELWWRVMVLE